MSLTGAELAYNRDTGLYTLIEPGIGGQVHQLKQLRPRDYTITSVVFDGDLACIEVTFNP